MNTKTTIQSTKHMYWAAALLLAAALAMPAAHATETPDIRTQGQAAMAAIQAELRTTLELPHLPRGASNQTTAVDAQEAVGTAIRRQRDAALRSIAWENEAQLHASTRVAADARPSRGGYVTVSAPMYYGADFGAN